jgi:hypothetical protein
MKKKLNKGKPIEELVKGSIEYTRSVIRDAFRAQFPEDVHGYSDLVDTFSDYVIVKPWSSANSKLKDDEYFRVTYTRDGETFTFAPRDQWEVVELAYQPQSRIAESKKKKGQRIEERVDARVSLLEREEGKARKIRIDGAIQADVVNGNGRLYPGAVLQSAVAELSNHLNESAGQGRAIQVLGEAEHPSDKGGRPNLLETVTKWETVEFDGKNVNIEGRILETSKGKDILTLMEGDVMPGVSLRGYGEGKSVKKDNGKVFEVTELHLTGFDLVLEPSFENAAQLIESIQGESDMNLEELLKLLKDHPEAFQGITEAQVKTMGEAQLKALEEKMRVALGIDANADLAEALRTNTEKARKFDESQVKQAVEAAITEGTKDLPFGKKLNEQFIAAVRGANPTSPEQVKQLVEAKRTEYSQLASAGVLAGMGFDEKSGKITMVGDVLEEETGTPSYALASYQMLESVRRQENRKGHDLRKAETPNEIYTLRLLERFDELYQHYLQNESRMLQEALTTADLPLPYSVSRAIIEEVGPDLVASGLFDVGTITSSPAKLFYEVTVADGAGVDGTATAEEVTGGEEGVWYSLAKGRIEPDSVTVTSDPAGTTYVEGTDYVLDYSAGRIMFLSGGAIDANDVLVTYGYKGTRNGEMQPIPRMKTKLTSATIEAAADRLATQISREAIVFSRTQLGWDPVARTLANLIKIIRRKIDQGLFYAAYSAVKSIPNNSTAAWTEDVTQDSLAELVRLIGDAKVLVANRFYRPDVILMSLENAETLSNWEGFKRDGFPNAVLNAAGFAGSVKGLPIFASTEFPSSLIIVGNRELVQHRVLEPMTIKGPYPTYDIAGGTGLLIAADQYYVEEFNTTNGLVPEKGAFIPVTEDEGS